MMAAPGVPEPLSDYLSKQSSIKLESFLERTPETWRGKIQHRILSGDAAEEIIETATRENFDLIVTGTHGRKGLSRAFLGSVAERVVRQAKCPVMVVPHND